MADDCTTVADLRRRVARFVQERDWEQFHNPKDLAAALSIEASELLEEFLWRAPPARLEGDDRTAVAEELADVFIYALSLSNAIELDLSAAVEAKLAKNEAKYPADRVRGRAP